MKDLMNQVAQFTKPMGYKRLRSRVFKTASGFFRQIDFQRGAHGHYFFVNLCLHPTGFPDLLANTLIIPDRPSESECILRCRIDRIAPDGPQSIFRSGYVYPDDPATIELLPSLLSIADSWLNKWASCETVLAASDGELQPLLTVVPIIVEKTLAALRFFCAQRLGRRVLALDYLDRCRKAPTGGIDFSRVDEYLTSLVRNPEVRP